jgi:uncharacterized membrane protein
MLKARQNPEPLTQKYLAYILLIGGIIGFLASFILTVDTIKVIQNPGYTPSCSINPIISCGSIMETDQSAILGFPNSMIGIAAYAALMAFGIALLAGARFRRWLWLTIAAGLALAVIFIHWLIFESLFTIGSLCPFCMAVWIATIPTFWYIGLHTLKSTKLSKSRLYAFVRRHHADILITWLLLIIGLILNRFWDYWSSLL